MAHAIAFDVFDYMSASTICVHGEQRNTLNTLRICLWLDFVNVHTHCNMELALCFGLAFFPVWVCACFFLFRCKLRLLLLLLYELENHFKCGGKAKTSQTRIKPFRTKAMWNHSTVWHGMIFNASKATMKENKYWRVIAQIVFHLINEHAFACVWISITQKMAVALTLHCIAT